ETQAVAQVEKQIERPQKTEDEIVALVEKARASGVPPRILKLSCKEYEAIYPPSGEGDAVALLGTVTRQLEKQIDGALAEKKPGAVLVYGGALHNDLAPRAELAQFSFGPLYHDGHDGHKRLRYAEVDLYVPEIVAKDPSVVAEPWFARWKSESRG